MAIINTVVSTGNSVPLAIFSSQYFQQWSNPCSELTKERVYIHVCISAHTHTHTHTNKMISYWPKQNITVTTPYKVKQCVGEQMNTETLTSWMFTGEGHRNPTGRHARQIHVDYQQPCLHTRGFHFIAKTICHLWRSKNDVKNVWKPAIMHQEGSKSHAQCSGRISYWLALWWIKSDWHKLLSEIITQTVLCCLGMGQGPWTVPRLLGSSCHSKQDWSGASSHCKDPDHKYPLVPNSSDYTSLHCCSYKGLLSTPSIQPFPVWKEVEIEVSLQYAKLLYWADYVVVPLAHTGWHTVMESKAAHFKEQQLNSKGFKFR